MKFHIKLSRTCSVSVCLAWLACVGQAYAQTEGDAEPSNSRFSGFATFGMNYHRNPDVGIISSGSQFKPAYQGLSANLDTALGLQWDYKLTPATDLTLQGVVRAGDEFEPKLRMAYIKQVLGENLSVRAGRMRNPLFFDSDTSEIGYANTMIRTPIPLYTGTVGGQIDHIDGLNVQWRQPMEDFSLAVSANWGGAKGSHFDFSETPPNKFLINVSGLLNLSVALGFGDHLIRYSRTRVARFTADTDPPFKLYQDLAELGVELGNFATDFAANGQSGASQAMGERARLLSTYSKPYDGAQTYDSIGLSTTFAGFGILGEWTLLDTDTVMLGKVEAYQLTVNYPIGTFTPYVSYSSARRISNWAESNPITPTGLPGLEAIDLGLTGIGQTNAQMSKFFDYSIRGLSAGGRWEVARNMAAKIQYDYLSTPDSQTPGALVTRRAPFDNVVHMLSASLDVVF
jgi:hypothetical protein